VSATPSAGGNTLGWRGRAELDDGRTVFVKIGGDYVRHEAGLMVAIRKTGASQLAPQVLDFEDGPAPMLVLEDLSDAAWAPPYPADTSPLFDALAELAAVEAPAGFRPLEDWADGRGSRWAQVAADLNGFLQLGVCSAGWLDANVQALIDAEERVDLRGSSLVHNDVWAGNICFVDGRAKLVDWADSARGNADLDVAFAMVSVVSEGGQLPQRKLLADEGGWLARIAGHNALEASLPLPDWADPNSDMRQGQLQDLRVALPWAARALGLESPR